MSKTQLFYWENEQHRVATLEVRHNKYEMLLNVVAEFAELVKALMAELNELGIYPNEITEDNEKFVQFLVSASYNWNCRWRDLKTMLNEKLGLHGKEQL
ncbi:MAG: hypothetical protein ACOZAO_00740 [Patescibacteria group bacterium]